jgi:beta-lactamase regulating signal transducer with metallopeptidase domain
MQLLLDALTYHRNSAGALSVLVILLVRVTLVLVLTIVAGRLFSRASAAVQHRVWLLGLLGTLAVPALWAATPGWRMPLIVVQMELPQVDAAALSAGSLGWPELLAGVWLLGTLLGIVYFAVGIAAARRTFRKSLRCDDPQWLGALGEARRDTALRGPVELRVTSHFAAPAVWSLWRVRILVPQAAESWTFDQRRSVLVHELTHARRRDCWSQLLASLVCAVWWFHPLAWHAARRLRLLAEQAADDGVLRSGTGRTEYASHLLSIAITVGRMRRLEPAVLRAGGSDLERRIRAILDPTRMRYPLRDHHARMGWLVGCTLLVALSTCSPTEVQPLAQRSGEPQREPRIDLRLRLLPLPAPEPAFEEPQTAESAEAPIELITFAPTSGNLHNLYRVSEVQLVAVAPPVFQLLPNWEVGRNAAELIPNYVTGTAKTVLVRPSPAGVSLDARPQAAPVATATADMLSVR